MSEAHDLRKRFGLLVTGHRKRKRLTQEGLAAAAGLSSDMVGRIEAGKTGARFPSIERLASALDVDPAELFSSEITSNSRPPAMTELMARISTMSDRDVRWVSQLLDAALKPRS